MGNLSKYNFHTTKEPNKYFMATKVKYNYSSCIFNYRYCIIIFTQVTLKLLQVHIQLSTHLSQSNKFITTYNSIKSIYIYIYKSKLITRVCRGGIVGACGNVGERGEHAADARHPDGPEAERSQHSRRRSRRGAAAGENVGGFGEDQIHQSLHQNEHPHLR